MNKLYPCEVFHMDTDGPSLPAGATALSYKIPENRPGLTVMMPSLADTAAKTLIYRKNKTKQRNWQEGRYSGTQAH